MSGFNPFPQAAPDFSDPLGLLRACHGRIAARGADAEAREAMARIHRYFSTAAQHHHEDEESDLFPMLRGRDPQVDNLMDELLREHQKLADNWGALEPFLVSPEQAVRASELSPVVERFVAAYRAHAEKENARLLPRAGELLNPAEITRLGQSMAQRRQA